MVGRVLRLPCGGAALDREDAAGQDRAILPDPWLTVRLWWDVHEKFRPVEAAYRATIIARMAGREAELAFLGASLCDQQRDREQILRLAEYLYSEGGWIRHRARLGGQAKRLVARHRERIDRVAGALAARGRLQAEEIDAMVLGAPRVAAAGGHAAEAYSGAPK